MAALGNCPPAWPPGHPQAAARPRRRAARLPIARHRAVRRRAAHLPPSAAQPISLPLARRPPPPVPRPLAAPSQ
jgi:hypothetical protein